MIILIFYYKLYIYNNNLLVNKTKIVKIINFLCFLDLRYEFCNEIKLYVLNSILIRLLQKNISLTDYKDLRTYKDRSDLYKYI